MQITSTFTCFLLRHPVFIQIFMSQVSFICLCIPYILIVFNIIYSKYKVQRKYVCVSIELEIHEKNVAYIWDPSIKARLGNSRKIQLNPEVHICISTENETLETTLDYRDLGQQGFSGPWKDVFIFQKVRVRTRVFFHLMSIEQRFFSVISRGREKVASCLLLLYISRKKSIFLHSSPITMTSKFVNIGQLTWPSPHHPRSENQGVANNTAIICICICILSEFVFQVNDKSVSDPEHIM